MYKQRIVIDLEYGSPFQKQVNQEAIDVMLKALKIHMDAAHKKNSVSYTITDQ